MDQFALGLTLVGGFLLFVNLLTSVIRSRLYLSEALLALLFGIAVGPAALDLINLGDTESTRRLLGHAARISVGLAVMDAALSLPRGYFAGRRKAIALILGPGMLLMWGLSSAALYLFAEVPLLIAMTVGAILTPTDPVLATAVVEGEAAEKNIPTRVRRFLLAESAANDGLAFPILMLPLLLLGHSTAPAAVETWLFSTLLVGVAASAALGAAIGYATAQLLRLAVKPGQSAPTPLLTLTIALSLLVSGLVDLYHGAEILAVFLAGLVFDHSFVSKEQVHAERVQESFRRFLELPVFILFGIALPWASWMELGWTGPAVACAVLLLRRLPMILLLRRWLAPIHDHREALFYGWFGPIGIAALGFAVVAWERTQDESVWALASIVVAASILAHGVTATPLAERLGRHRNNQ